MAGDEDKFKESIWAIHSKWRGWFYGVLSLCGVVVSSFTLYEKWSESWLAIFNAIRDGIVSSVVVVWFVFQLVESVMGAYQYFQDLKERKIQKICQEEEEQIMKRLDSIREKRVPYRILTVIEKDIAERQRNAKRRIVTTNILCFCLFVVIGFAIWNGHQWMAAALGVAGAATAMWRRK